jgi:3-hydroxyisobutyrate dehydrogenase-like beta-hydroxyacid dehydrogenase
MAAVKRSLNVGMIGAGRVGQPILVNLAFKARNSLYLQIHSRSRAKAAQLVDKVQRDGAQVACRMHDKYGTMSKWCDVIVVCLKDEEAQHGVMLGRADALLTNAKRGQIIIDHTTSNVNLSRECYEVAHRRGAAYLDAPLSGTLEQARSGMLTAMIGGDKAAFQRALPIIRLYSENAHFMGGPGSGTAARTIAQSLVAMHTVAAAEAVSLADSMGFEDMGKLLEVLDSTQGASAALRRNGKDMTRLIRNPDEIPPEGVVNVDSLLHDISLARGSTPGLPDSALPLLTTTRRAFAQASQAGVGGMDATSVVHFLEGAGGVAAPADAADGQEAALGTDGAGEEADTQFY